MQKLTSILMKKTVLANIHNFEIEYIRKDIKTFVVKAPEPKKNTAVFDDSDDDFIQISIFDELD